MKLSDPAGFAVARLVLTFPSDAMKDLLFTLITVGFFVAAWYYARACERL
jgi:hypothetical protein